MFTGIVEELGTVAALERHDGHARLTIACDEVLKSTEVGDSVAVNGCCVTVTVLDDARSGEAPPLAGAWPGWQAAVDATPTRSFAVDLMAETLRATGLGDLDVGDPVNLERAMASGDRFGGHLVQGHVDGVGRVLDRAEQPGTVFLTVGAPAEVAPYLVAKGSVTVDGVSLTVVDVTAADSDAESAPQLPAAFRVGLIPHTLAVTVLGSRDVGDRVNLEADVVAKYVERLVTAGAPTPYDAAVPAPAREG